MDRQETELIVLARIPDLGSVGRSRHRGRSLASRGRVIGQALSFKLLAIATLLLVAMALVPLTVHKSSQSADPPPTAAGGAAPVAQAPAPVDPGPSAGPSPSGRCSTTQGCQCSADAGRCRDTTDVQMAESGPSDIHASGRQP